MSLPIVFTVHPLAVLDEALSALREGAPHAAALEVLGSAVAELAHLRQQRDELQVSNTKLVIELRTLRGARS